MNNEIQKCMTASRAAGFLDRFKHDEKMLGPEERAALDFAIAALAAQELVAQPQAAQEPVAWKWRRHALDKWTCVGFWDSIEAQAAREMERQEWDVVRLYDHESLQAVQAMPDGWKWVPVEPTPAMVTEGTAHTIRADEEEDGDEYRARGCAISVYKDMLAAAPSAPALPEPQEHKAPRIPDYAMTCIQTYGDARADDDGTSGARLGEAIKALRKWGASLAAPQAAQAMPSGMTLVNTAALQMVINALRRDAEEGKVVRGEIADELLTSTPSAPAQPQRKPLPPMAAIKLVLGVSKNRDIVPGTTNWALAVARDIEAAHGIKGDTA